MIISIVTPCYNEADNLEELVSKFLKVREKIDLELILVNNGSTDNTFEIMNTLSEKYSFIKIVSIRANKGYGDGILQGLKAARGEFVGWTHADLQTDPYDIVKAVEIVNSNNKRKTLYIKGYRNGRSLFDTFLSRSMAMIVSLLFQKRVQEINAQPNIFHKSFVGEMENPPLDFNLDLYVYLTALKRGCELHRINTHFPPRKRGVSKWNKGIGSVARFALKTLKYSIELRFKL